MAHLRRSPHFCIELRRYDFTLPPHNLLLMVQSYRQEGLTTGNDRGVSGMYILAIFQRIMGVLGSRYRPELHYMRGPGPKWYERHARAVSGQHLPRT